MMLSGDQSKSVRQGEAVPIRVDETECVVIRKDVYDNILRGSYDDSEVDARDAYPLMDAVAKREGWDDPSEDLYDDLVPEKP